MIEMALIPLVTGADERERRSALPDSPVVAARPPGRARLAAARMLHRLGSRLDGQVCRFHAATRSA